MIIYHADDYGISINASKEILSLVQQGKLSGISVIPKYELLCRLYRSASSSNERTSGSDGCTAP